MRRHTLYEMKSEAAERGEGTRQRPRIRALAIADAGRAAGTIPST